MAKMSAHFSMLSSPVRMDGMQGSGELREARALWRTPTHIACLTGVRPKCRAARPRGIIRIAKKTQTQRAPRRAV